MNWYSRPCKAEVKHEIGGDRPGRIFDIGSYSVTVFEDGVVEYSDRREGGDPKGTFPNMEVRDGEVRILVSDLASEVLKRMEPEDLARSLWQNEDVRSALMDCLVTRYNQEGIGDAERRKFLSGVKEAVHSKALDELARVMSSQEYSATKRSFFYNEINHANDLLRDNECKDVRGNLIQIRHGDNDADFKISGTHWNDAKDFWRDKALKQFPAQTSSEEPRAAQTEFR